METWAPMALCWHYCSANFDEQRVQVDAADGALCELRVTWAVGVLADGDWEVLGAWPGSAVGSAFWRSVWRDFDSRGIEKISLICASDPDARALCPAVKVLPPFGRVLGQSYVPANSSVGMLRADARRAIREASGFRAARIALGRLLANAGSGGAGVLSPDWPEVLESLRPFYALRPHRRALVRAGDEHLEQLGCSLSRAVGRHGPFADRATAVSFVAQTLSRDELRLKSFKLSKSARPAVRLVGADMTSRALLNSDRGGCKS
jgi:hypothetical protein